MHIAILGATSQIAKDLVLCFSKQSDHELVLYARRPEIVTQWLKGMRLSGRYPVANFTSFSADEHFDAIINFVGSGDPAKTVAMGASIFDVTMEYDSMVLDYVRRHRGCRYLFLSSGVAYGDRFDAPVGLNSKATVSINGFQPEDWYAVAKLCAECRHRALWYLPIIDIRVFSYFSRSQDLNARFLVSDILRAIRDGAVLRTSADYIVRDFMNPADFYGLVIALLGSMPANAVVDCYSKAPVDKPALLKEMQDRFGLQYEVSQSHEGAHGTGSKGHYYSRNTRAADFGYCPSLTSLEGVMQEAQILLGRQGDQLCGS